MMTYKGYIGIARVDDEAGVIRGKVVNVKDTITFQGESVEAARAAFRESVDDYLEFCKDLGETPEKPFSGKILIRLRPEVHRKLNMVAQIEGLSVNRLVNREILRVVRRAGLLGPAAAPKEAGADTPATTKKKASPKARTKK
jgi:predicted HicB family RNase H-like nuclease